MGCGIEDVEEHCRRMLAGHGHVEHVFGDLLGQITELASMTPEERLLFLAGLPLQSRMQVMARFTWDARPFCFLHQRYCTAASPTIVVAGTPCVDHSQAGSRRTALFSRGGVQILELETFRIKHFGIKRAWGEGGRFGNMSST
jgi:hypothetical protein